MTLKQIIDKAMEKADSAQATMVTKETSAVDYENDRLKSAESSQRTQIDLKVIVDGKVATSSTTDPADIDGVVERALEAAAFGSPAHFEVPDPQELDPVKIFDPALLQLEKKEMIHMGQHMMDMIKSYNPEIMASAGVKKTVFKVAYANSKGADYSAEHTDLILAQADSLHAAPTSSSQAKALLKRSAMSIRKRLPLRQSNTSRWQK